MQHITQLRDALLDLSVGDRCTIVFETETCYLGALSAIIEDKGREPSASIRIEALAPGTDDLLADEPELSGEGCLSYLDIPREDLGVVALDLDHVGSDRCSVTEVYPTAIITTD